MPSKDNRPQGLLNVTSELKASYNCLLGVYEASKKATPKAEVLLREIEKTQMLLDHAKLAVYAADTKGLFSKLLS